VFGTTAYPVQFPVVSGEANPQAHALSELGGVLFGEETLDAVLGLVLTLACSSVPPADWVSVTMSGDDSLHTRSATSPEVRDLDGDQYQLNQGPCVEATRTGNTVNVLIDSPDFPWPEFGDRARTHGVGSILSTPLRVRDKTVGALNIYSRDAELFGDADRELAGKFAEEASVVLANAVTFMSMELVNEQLKEAVASRDVIGQAKGILMARQSCTADEAFDILRRGSQRENRKLRELAEDLAASVGKEPGRG
jgi:GAF domain-containing protein